MDESSSKQPARPFLQQPPPGRRPKTLSEFFADCLRWVFILTEIWHQNNFKFLDIINMREKFNQISLQKVTLKVEEIPCIREYIGSVIVGRVPATQACSGRVYIVVSQVWGHCILTLWVSLGKVVYTVKRAGTYAAKVPPQELHKIAVRDWAVEDSPTKT